MKVIYNNLVPFRGFRAVNLFGVVFARKASRPLPDTVLRHERIHTEQMRDLLYIGFYPCYLGEWLFRLLFRKGDAYRGISFEREAYARQGEPGYIESRRWCAQWRKKEGEKTWA